MVVVELKSATARRGAESERERKWRAAMDVPLQNLLPGRTMIVMGEGRRMRSCRDTRAPTLRSNRTFVDFCHAMDTDRAMISMDAHDHMKLRRTAQAGYSRTVIEGNMDTCPSRSSGARSRHGPSVDRCRRSGRCNRSWPSTCAFSPPAARHRVRRRPEVLVRFADLCRAARPPEGPARVPAAKGAAEDQGAVPSSGGTARSGAP